MEKCSVFKAAAPSSDLEGDNAYVYTHEWSLKNKEMVYIPMGGLPNINVLVNTQFWG